MDIKTDADYKEEDIKVPLHAQVSDPVSFHQSTWGPNLTYVFNFRMKRTLYSWLITIGTYF